MNVYQTMSLYGEAFMTEGVPAHGRAAAKRYDKLARTCVYSGSPKAVAVLITAHMQLYAQAMRTSFSYTSGEHSLTYNGKNGGGEYSFLSMPIAKVHLPPIRAGALTSYTGVRIRATIGGKGDPSLISTIKAINLISAAFNCQLFFYRKGAVVWGIWRAFDGLMCEVVDVGDAIISYGYNPEY